MKTWKTLIVDDEPLARQELKRLLEPYMHIYVTGEAASVESASLLIEKLQPDLVFLDIDLGTHSGFDLLEVTDNSYQTIFVTAYDEFAVRAFEINALDYLLKPVHPERLNKAIQRLGSPFKEEVKTTLVPTDKILVSSRQCSRFISVKAINYIEANGDYSNIYAAHGFMGMAHTTIKKWMERLPEALFVQIHRSFIVNINWISEIIKNPNGNFAAAILHQEKQLPISRNHLKKIRSKYKFDH